MLRVGVFFRRDEGDLKLLVVVVAQVCDLLSVLKPLTGSLDEMSELYGVSTKLFL